MALKCRILNFDDIIGVSLTFKSSKVISIAENALLLIKIQVKENVSAFNTILWIDINIFIIRCDIYLASIRN